MQGSRSILSHLMTTEYTGEIQRYRQSSAYLALTEAHPPSLPPSLPLLYPESSPVEGVGIRTSAEQGGGRSTWQKSEPVVHLT